MSPIYEVEIKSLLGSQEAAHALISNLKELYPETYLIHTGRQLNHYFNIPADMGTLKNNLHALIPPEKKTAFEKIIMEGDQRTTSGSDRRRAVSTKTKKVSLRTRDADGTVILVLKASVGDDTSFNGVTRIEFEEKVSLTLNELDHLLLGAGATYQAKWSREREEYKSGDVHVCIDKNAGYGYVAEFERITDDEGSLEQIKNELISIMDMLGVRELPQDRLERMFAHYNANWQKYYETENTFTIE